MSAIETFFLILGVVLTVGIILLFVWEFGGALVQSIRHSHLIAAQNKAFRANNPHLKRKQCMQCKYCRKKLSKPLYTIRQWDHYVPNYCKKFKKPLAPNLILICQAELEELAEHDLIE